ncbi:enoyl-CoA hydratase-related protein [Ruegeria faecimaris]|uniref:2-(1,2-epoxy-1,2-dihydrophenyl)acetyl-CoA isomerase n=1 Tax=Ruegeria faecimaris TaxID=686389 RepID=A0A521B8G6_9RHOB|nr:enoyl-CoA hydratase-related protein [Ruegeria faecimaris]SMO43363.1 2-(1,2-epoxy-1,2-dihydrophenyl)acetyl-CoA isomerase [Ruegeria faecimaris]
MEYEAILLDIADDLAVVTLNRPEKLNAMTAQLRAEVTHAMKHAATHARAIVLTGKGNAFCSGQDLGDASSTGKIDLERTLRDEYEPMLEAIYNCPVPTIAAVNGAAAGAGANLALCADIVIATESAYFLQAFARIGLLPDAGGTWFMPRQMGFAKAMGAALFADKISARQADDWGLIWEAVPDAEFEAHWRKRAMYLAKGPTSGFGAIKKAIRGTYENTLPQQLEAEAHLQGECGRSRDFSEGVVAFMQKRPPKFEGR